MTAEINCPNCGEAAGSGANYCVRCGSRLPMGCPNCGATNPADSRFCRACGAGLSAGERAAVPPPCAVSCPRCRTVNESGAIYCYACGLPFDESGGRQARMVIAGGIPAGFWVRVLAAVIDGIVLTIVWLILLVILPGISIESYYSDTSSLWSGYDTLSVLIGVAYYTTGVSVFSTTVGKRVLGLYVLRPDGSRVGVGRAFARYWAPLLSALILFGGFLMVAFRQDKRALHDLICDTVVVQRRD